MRPPRRHCKYPREEEEEVKKGRYGAIKVDLAGNGGDIGRRAVKVGRADDEWREDHVQPLLLTELIHVHHIQLMNVSREPRTLLGLQERETQTERQRWVMA